MLFVAEVTRRVEPQQHSISMAFPNLHLIVGSTQDA